MTTKVDKTQKLKNIFIHGIKVGLSGISVQCLKTWNKFLFLCAFTYCTQDFSCGFKLLSRHIHTSSHVHLLWDGDTSHVNAILTWTASLSMTGTLVNVSPLRLNIVEKKTDKTEKGNHSVVLCVCVMAQWNTSLCDASEERHASHGQSLVPPRSPHLDTPGWSLWYAPFWEHKQSRGNQVGQKYGAKVSNHYPLHYFNSLIATLVRSKFFTGIFIIATHLIW